MQKRKDVAAKENLDELPDIKSPLRRFIDASRAGYRKFPDYQSGGNRFVMDGEDRIAFIPVNRDFRNPVTNRLGE